MPETFVLVHAAWHTGGMKAQLSEGQCRAIPLVISKSRKIILWILKQ